MVTVRHKRRAPAKRSAAPIWRPSRQALAGLLRDAATELSVAHSVCVAVQAALRCQGAAENRELELCLRTQVAEAIRRNADNLRMFAQQLAPARLVPEE